MLRSVTTTQVTPNLNIRVNKKSNFRDTIKSQASYGFNPKSRGSQSQIKFTKNSGQIFEALTSGDLQKMKPSFVNRAVLNKEATTENSKLFPEHHQALQKDLIKPLV